MKMENPKMISIEHIRLCRTCIDAIKSHGENVWVGSMIEREEDLDERGHWSVVDGLTCEWCEEEDVELYDCHF